MQTSEPSTCDALWITCSPRIFLYLLYSYVYMNMQVQIRVLWINGAVTINYVLGVELNILTSLFSWKKGLLRFNIKNKSQWQWDIVSNDSLPCEAVSSRLLLQRTSKTVRRETCCAVGWKAERQTWKLNYLYSWKFPMSLWICVEFWLVKRHCNTIIAFLVIINRPVFYSKRMFE
jgi:hypothetical protein